MQFDSGWRIRGRSEGGDFLKSWPDSLVAGVDSRLHLSRFGELAACTLLLEPLFFFWDLKLCEMVSWKLSYFRQTMLMSVGWKFCRAKLVSDD